MISVDDFQLEARAWLAANREGAPRDYGAICPPDLVEQGVALLDVDAEDPRGREL